MNQLTNTTNTTNTNQKPKFSVAIQTDTYRKLIEQTLGDSERAKKFVASISSAVAVNSDLQECEAGTILSCALLGEALNLSPSPQLGQYYLVPFNSKSKGKVATFILGYKGYIQLAVRSGNYKKINVIEIKEGELIKFDLMNEEIEVNMIQDDTVRENTPTIGYYAMFEYSNGFKKAIYWSKKKMIEHADKYSPAFNKKSYELLEAGKVKEADMWKYSSHWYKNFDDMSKKTMLRQLISRWGVMSIEMREAFENDEKVIYADGSSNFLDDVDIPEVPEIENLDNDSEKEESKKKKTTKVDINEL